MQACIPPFRRGVDTCLCVPAAVCCLLAGWLAGWTGVLDVEATASLRATRNRSSAAERERHGETDAAAAAAHRVCMYRCMHECRVSTGALCCAAAMISSHSAPLGGRDSAACPCLLPASTTHRRSRTPYAERVYVDYVYIHYIYMDVHMYLFRGSSA